MYDSSGPTGRMEAVVTHSMTLNDDLAKVLAIELDFWRGGEEFGSQRQLSTFSSTPSISSS